MSIVKTIYKLPYEMNIDECHMTVGITIKYRGINFYGAAVCHTDDKDFFSPRVGKRIALSRVRIKILKYEYQESKKIYEIKRQFYNEIGRFVDNMDVMYDNVERARRRVYNLKKAIKKEEKTLNWYLQDQEEMIQIIKRNRAKGNNN